MNMLVQFECQTADLSAVVGALDMSTVGNLRIEPKDTLNQPAQPAPTTQHTRSRQNKRDMAAYFRNSVVVHHLLAHLRACGTKGCSGVKLAEALARRGYQFNSASTALSQLVRHGYVSKPRKRFFIFKSLPDGVDLSRYQ